MFKTQKILKKRTFFEHELRARKGSMMGLSEWVKESHNVLSF